MTTNPRIRSYLGGAVIFLAVIALIVGMTGCGCGGYTAPPVHKLEIRTWYDLDAIRDDLDANYILMNDLDPTTPGYVELAGSTANQGKGWEPIGYGGYWLSPWFGPREGGPIFKGSFDGQGHEIRDLYINRGGLIGLFGFVSKGGIVIEGGIIKNIALINATVTAGETAADPVGLDQYSVKCLDVGTMEAYGGLVGYNGGTVSNCYATVNVTGLWSVGGLVGYNDGTVSNCYAMGNVAGDSEVGGLVGWNAGMVKNSYSACSVNGKSSIGGLVGSGVDYHVDGSFWNTEISGQATSAGGTGRTAAEMMDITTFSGAGWNITTVADIKMGDTSYVWNIVDGVTYPFLS